MSWLLLQLLNNTERSYEIIHSIDLLENYETVLINCKVKYYCKNDKKLLSGIVICISENRVFIEDELKIRLEYDNNEEEIEKTSTSSSSSLKQKINENNWYLVQYSKNKNNLIHAIVNNNEISWPIKSFDNNQGSIIYVNDDNQLRSALILRIENNETKLFDELQNLKDFCCTKLITDNLKSQLLSSSSSSSTSHTVSTNELWLLVQYSCGINNIVYATINSNETVWRSENQFNESVAYLTDGSAIYQGIIIKKSINKNDIDDALKKITTECAITSILHEYDDNDDDNDNDGSDNIEKIDNQTQTTENFMLADDDDNMSNENIENDRQDNDNEIEKETQLELLQQLEDMESNIQDEAKSLSYSLRYAEIVNSQMEQRLIQLSNYLHLN